MKVTRRNFAKIVGSAAIGATTLPIKGAIQPEDEKSSAQQNNQGKFPKDFLWGSATAAYQVEGAVNEDGRNNQTAKSAVENGDECAWSEVVQQAIFRNNLKIHYHGIHT